MDLVTRFRRPMAALAALTGLSVGTPASAASVRLQPGEMAPAFQITDVDGRSVNLEDFRGQKLLLSFFRYASCFFCNLRAHALIERYPSLHRQGLQVLAVFESPPDKIRQYVGKGHVPFPLLPDPRRDLYGPYGVEARSGARLKAAWRLGDIWQGMQKGLISGDTDGEADQLPAEFLIGPDLRVVDLYYGQDAGDHMPMERIEAFLMPSAGQNGPAAEPHD